MNFIILKLIQTLSAVASKLTGVAQQKLLEVIQKLADKFGIDLDPDSVAISGDAVQNQILTADLSNVDFDDGSGFTFQWQADGQNILDADQQSYTLTQDDVGKEISLQLTYTDVNGNTVVLSSGATLEVANVNDAVTGNVLIEGIAEQGQTLIANTAELADLDGLGELAYQWFADGVAIAGANAANYTLTQTDVGKAITVAVNYVDGFGAEENVVSAATAAIANVNDTPIGDVVIEGLAQEDQTLVANTDAIADVDGLGEFSYQWFADGVAIGGANAANYTLNQADVGKAITVQISYTDQYNTAENIVSAATTAVANLNDNPTGTVVIEGLAQEAQILVANTEGIADADGLGQFSYQWLADGVAIDGATAASYTLAEADVGKVITVQVNYVDQYNTAETLASSPTVAVLPDADLYVPEQAVLELSSTGVSANGELQDSSVQTIQTGEANDLLVVNAVIDGLAIDLGENGDTDNDIVDVSNLQGVTYTASSGALTDAQGNSLTLDNVETIRLDAEATTVVLDKGGDYNFVFAANGNNYTNNDPTTIKMIEGTGQTNVGLFFEEYTAENAPTLAGIQKLNLEMEFNDVGPNVNNVAEIDFADGNYSFNATAIEYGLIAALIATAILAGTINTPEFSALLAQFAESTSTPEVAPSTSTLLFNGETRITLTADFAPTDPGTVDADVTARVSGLSDNTVTIRSGTETTEYQPWSIVDNQSGRTGIADFTIVKDRQDLTPEPTEPEPEPELATLNVSWDGAANNGEGRILVNSVDSTGASTSNVTALYGFSELQLSVANDKFSVYSLNDYSEAIVSLGEKEDSSDYDILDLSALTTGATYTAANGVLSSDSKVLTVTGAEEIVGTNHNDTLVGDSDDNVIKGGQGDDTLTGGEGDDVLTGGEGADTFVFAPGSGNDIITDYDSNDILQFDPLTVTEVEVFGAGSEFHTIYHFETGDTLSLLWV